MSLVRAVATLTLLAAAPLAAQTVELRAEPQAYVPVRIKDVDLRARVGLGFDRAAVFNGAAAARARLKAFPLFGKRTVTNPMLPGGRATFRGNFVKLGVNGGDMRRTPTGWVDLVVAPDADGIVSIFSIPAQRVVINRAGPASRRHIVPRAGPDESHAKARIGDEEVRVTLDLTTPYTMMNARAAQALVNEGLARRTGRAGLWEPVPGVRLPYERLTPSAGAALLGLPLVSPAARITNTRLKELDAKARAGTPEEDDEDTITVTARGERRGRAPWIIVGLDVLGQCGRIELDRPGRRWVLDCGF